MGSGDSFTKFLLTAPRPGRPLSVRPLMVPITLLALPQSMAIGRMAELSRSDFQIFRTSMNTRPRAVFTHPPVGSALSRADANI